MFGQIEISCLGGVEKDLHINKVSSIFMMNIFENMKMTKVILKVHIVFFPGQDLEFSQFKVDSN